MRRFRVPLIILRHCTTLFEHIPNITATSHFICVHCRGSSKWGSDFRDGPSHFSPIHHWPLIEFSTMLTCHGSDLLQRTPQMIDLLGIWGIWRPDQHLELFVTFLWLFPCMFCGVWGRILSSVVRSIALGTRFTMLFGWVMWCQDPSFPCRALNCEAMVSVTHMTWVCVVVSQQQLRFDFQNQFIRLVGLDTTVLLSEESHDPRCVPRELPHKGISNSDDVKQKSLDDVVAVSEGPWVKYCVKKEKNAIASFHAVALERRSHGGSYPTCSRGHVWRLGRPRQLQAPP